MEEPKTLYAPEESAKKLSLSQEQKNAISEITLGIDEVDMFVRSRAIPDIIDTLENGHPLNRLITNSKGTVVGYIACEDRLPHEVYIKYLGSTKQTDRNLLSEIPAFLAYAKKQKYEKLSFHGWNNRLNNVLEHWGFNKMRTDELGEFKVDFFEKRFTGVEQKGAD